ncbi:hypothetical protein Taro_001712 [Colocasia esculenta]|uniref:Uncharacterized protein n=1 Tax=Colocasia esculenta TaxID=4460 RepID=A0A843TIQ9_COLES|nr:hypothetical protein [Colocasia esculenta]
MLSTTAQSPQSAADGAAVKSHLVSAEVESNYMAIGLNTSGSETRVNHDTGTNPKAANTDSETAWTKTLATEDNYH